MKNKLFLAVDVDTDKEAFRLAEMTADSIGGFKIGPRLAVRYGGEFLKKMATFGSLFVDCKYFDIPSTMEGAVRASFAMGASFVTVHAQAGSEALRRLAGVESELRRERPFQVLAVTVLTSFNLETLPSVLHKMPITEMVSELGDLVIEQGLTGLVCSTEEVAVLRKKFPKAFLLVPGIRLPGDPSGDQKRLADPASAMRAGASALVIGRPIVEAKNPAAAAAEYLRAIS